MSWHKRHLTLHKEDISYTGCEVHGSPPPFPCPHPGCTNGITGDEALFQYTSGEQTPLFRMGWPGLDSAELRYFTWIGEVPALVRDAMSIFRSEVDQFLSPPSTVFHYCSLPSLLEILKTRSFFMTDYRFLNDSRELSEGIDRTNIALQSLIDRLPPTNKWRDAFREAKKQLRPENAPRFYVACFSDDGDALTQWKGFGSGGRGAAIGVDLTPLLQQRRSSRPAFLRQVAYDSQRLDKITDYLCTILGLLWEALDSLERDDGVITNEVPHPSALVPRMMPSIWELCASVKHPSFLEERETRLVQIDHRLGDRSGCGDLQFRATDDRVIPYRTTLEIDSRNLHTCTGCAAHTPHFRCVWIGPLADQALVELGVRELLETVGLTEVIVQLSKIPLR